MPGALSPTLQSKLVLQAEPWLASRHWQLYLGRCERLHPWYRQAHPSRQTPVAFVWKDDTLGIDIGLGKLTNHLPPERLLQTYSH